MAEIFYPDTIAERLNCDGEAFGSFVMRILTSSGQPRRFPRKAKKRISDLQQDIKRLYASTDEDDRDVVAQINEYFSLYDGPAIASDAVPRDNVVQWLATAKYDDFVEFARRNTTHNQQATETLNDHQSELNHYVMERTKLLVSSGDFPAVALSSLRTAIRKNRGLRAMDGFEASAYGSVGYSSDGRLTLANPTHLPMSTMLADPPLEFKQTLYHEFLHLAACFDNSGLSTLYTKNIPFLWLDEEFAEHYACFEPGHAGPTRPLDPDLDQYSSERQLIANALASPVACLSSELLSEAAFSPQESQARYHVEQKLRRYFATISPPSIEDPLLDFSNAYETNEYEDSPAAAAIVQGYYERAGIEY